MLRLGETAYRLSMAYWGVKVLSFRFIQFLLIITLFDDLLHHFQLQR